ncbi:MAG: class II aldolase/adducin family protein, partial [Bdellovibrionota bacterium]
MKNQWSDQESSLIANDVLALRVYTSRLLGSEESLVLHGGGNTSAKDVVKNIFGETEPVLYVKGSGQDLRTIDKQGFSRVRLDPLVKMAHLPALSDLDLVQIQRSALLVPSDPEPSVEAILHALIPLRFVDHTHSDALLALSNTPDSENRLRKLFSAKKVLILPYEMPGFKLARQVFLATRDADWKGLEAIVLLRHGVFT